MTLRIACADGNERERAIAAAHAAVRRGDLVVLPTESAYAVATDAFSVRGVTALREAKGIDDRVPLPVMVGKRATVGGIAYGIGDDARALMEAFWPGPLTLLLTPQPSLAWELPRDAPVAVRMPLHPVALAVLASTGPLVVTGANMPGLPAPLDVDDALAQLGDPVSVALDCGPLLGDPNLDPPMPSTIVDLSGPVPLVVRVGAVSVDRLRAVCPHVLDGQGSIDA